MSKDSKTEQKWSRIQVELACSHRWVTPGCKPLGWKLPGLKRARRSDQGCDRPKAAPKSAARTRSTLGLCRRVISSGSP